MTTFFQLPPSPQPDTTRMSLFPLEPRGMGTGHLESLSSYVSRLADEHWMLCRTLLNKLHMQYNQDRHFTLRGEYNIDGQHSASERTVHDLEAASPIQGLRNLTLLPLRNACDPMGKLSARQNMRWCSQCWKSDVAMGQPPYVRLVWVIQTVDICSHHDCTLSVVCPSCSAPQRNLPSIPRCWLCRSCGEELYRERSPLRLRVKGNAQRYWFARAAEALIESTCASDIGLAEQCVSRALRGLIGAYSEESTELFSKQTNIPKRYVTNWLHGTSRPVLPALFDLCYRINIPPDQFLMGSGVLTAPEQWRKGSARNFLEVEKLSDAKKNIIACELKSIIDNNPQPPPMVSAIANKFGLDFTQLRYHFKDEYTAIKQRADSWRSKMSNLEKQQRIDRAVAAAEQLISEGIYPSDRQLRDRKFVRASDLRRVEILAAIRDLQNRVKGTPGAKQLIGFEP